MKQQALACIKILMFCEMAFDEEELAALGEVTLHVSAEGPFLAPPQGTTFNRNVLPGCLAWLNEHAVDFFKVVAEFEACVCCCSETQKTPSKKQ